MELLSSFKLNPLRIYTLPKRIRNKKGIATFPEKHIASYLDYSVDFSNRLDSDESIIQGKIVCNHKGLNIDSSFFKSHLLTAFLSGGEENLSFYLTFTVQTNKGNEFFQEIILPTYGCFPDKNISKDYKFAVLEETSIAPDHRPPLNALYADDFYLIYKKNSYIMV